MEFVYNTDGLAFGAQKFIIVAVKISVFAFVTVQCAQRFSLLAVNYTIAHFEKIFSKFNTSRVE